MVWQEKKEAELNSALRQILRADVYRYRGQTNRRAYVSAYLHEPGFRFTYYLRKVAFYNKRKKWIGFLGYVFDRIQLHHYRFKYGFDISPATGIGPGLYLGHFGGVVISPQAVFGANVNIAHGVTIGAVNKGPRAGAPILGDRVWVGANAIIVGNVTIGNDALIAPGAYVNYNVPSMAIVLGNPGRVVSNAGSVGYINNIIDSQETGVHLQTKDENDIRK